MGRGHFDEPNSPDHRHLIFISKHHKKISSFLLKNETCQILFISTINRPTCCSINLPSFPGSREVYSWPNVWTKTQLKPCTWKLQCASPPFELRFWRFLPMSDSVLSSCFFTRHHQWNFEPVKDLILLSDCTNLKIYPFMILKLQKSCDF